MKISERILLVFYGLVVVFLVTFLGVAVWNDGILWHVLRAGEKSVYLRIAFTAGLLAVAVIAVRCMFVGIKSKGGNAALAATTQEGGIYINIDTVSDLAVKAVKKTEGVREVKVRTAITDIGANIAVKTSMAYDAVIPTVSAEVQQNVKNDIETLCGIKVNAVTVQVDNSLQLQK